VALTLGSARLCKALAGSDCAFQWASYPELFIRAIPVSARRHASRSPTARRASPRPGGVIFFGVNRRSPYRLRRRLTQRLSRRHYSGRSRTWFLSRKACKNLPDEICLRTCGGEGDANALGGVANAGANFQQAQAKRFDPGAGEPARLIHCLLHLDHRRVCGRMQEKAHLIGLRRGA
jgi:hypothetical protein